MATKGTDTLDTASLQALLGPQLTAEQAALIFQQGQEAVVFALSDLGQAIGREAGRRATTPDPVGTFGTNSALRQADRQGAGQSQRCQAGTSRSSSTRAAADRPPRGAHALGLSQVPRAGSSLPLARGRGSSRTSPPTSRRWSPSTRSIATGARSAATPSSRSCPTPCPARPSACGSWSSRPGCTTCWAPRWPRSSTCSTSISSSSSPPAAWCRCGSGCGRSSWPGTWRSRPKPSTAPCCTPTRPAGGSTARPTGCGASRRRT